MLFCLIWIFVLLAGQAFLFPAAGISKSLSKPIIVVNPGHGGPDHGAQGSDGTLEKHITLTLTNLIIKNLEADYQAISTRTGDYFITLADRAALANHNRAALFLSIHAGGSFHYQTSGITIAYLDHDSFSQDSVQGLAQDSAPSYITWDQMQRDQFNKSAEAGKCIQKRLAGNRLFPKPRLSGLPLRVLSGANMPALLIEIGYLTNPVEEKKLKDMDYLTKLAAEIANGIDDFLSKSGKATTP